MGTKEKLIERFKSLPANFTFEEMERLLSIFGYEKSNKGKTSGSRVIIIGRLSPFLKITLEPEVLPLFDFS